ncbi:uncharacterized protein PFL1_03803 [Pseudozyma flocculosa PF-1]|uniref:Queuosine 5'-phosphate N-glycosylase/hydrolase n=2 Tax=Pseudozyma flocculosa TaxID=84751 RepID=A0A5C3EZL1_9BASI|nr:uncharacterized protein PFL1_03803 [Pseudozyma flocculosa PF-1]EPQ28500.1 hypothetical protein PFL1_03803 [Pseudozyma flocculosa PF-1]SPO36421.1 uncharacterized protein PSFLO_01892 [Pseudozyma flocculosa]
MPAASSTSTPAPPPAPASGTFISSVRRSCRVAREAASISISTAAIDAFLLSLDRATFDRLKTQHGLVFPLQFPNLTAEVNFLAILSLLNTLSGYRSAFHSATGSGAYQNVQRLLFGLYLTGGDDAASTAVSGSSHLTAQGLANLSAGTVAELLGVSLHEEKKHDKIEAITVGIRGGPMNEAVELVVGLCNDTGKRLLDAGYPSLGAFVIEALKDAERLTADRGDEAGADKFIEKVVTFLPGFNDAYQLPTGPVYVFKKAFFLLQALHQRLGSPSSASSSLKVPQTTTTLPMFVDNVLPTMLVQLGIVDLSSCVVDALKRWGPVETKAQEPGAAEASEGKREAKDEGPTLTAAEAYTVRAACLDAGVEVVKRAKELAKTSADKAWLDQLNEVDLDGYLWAVAKDDGALRSVPRMVERNTVMY